MYENNYKNIYGLEEHLEALSKTDHHARMLNHFGKYIKNGCQNY